MLYLAITGKRKKNKMSRVERSGTRNTLDFIFLKLQLKTNKAFAYFAFLKKAIKAFVFLPLKKTKLYIKKI